MKRIEHLEDLAFTLDGHQLTNLCSALIHHVYGSGIRGANLSIKHDGICLVFGLDEKGRFWLSTKSYFNKTSVKYYSKEEINNSGRDPLLIEKLLWYFDYIQERSSNLPWASVFVCDVIRDPFCLIDDFSSRPNIIEYRFEKNPFSDFIIDIHDSNVTNSTYLYNIHQDILLDRKNFELLHHHLFNLRMQDPLWFPKDVKYQREMKKQVNDMIRANDVFYYMHVKSSCTRMNANFINLKLLKDSILTYLNKTITKPYECFIEGQPCNGEGYVFKYQNYVVKLVDRLEFSRRNFDQTTERGWSSPNL